MWTDRRFQVAAAILALLVVVGLIAFLFWPRGKPLAIVYKLDGSQVVGTAKSKPVSVLDIHFNQPVQRSSLSFEINKSAQRGGKWNSANTDYQIAIWALPRQTLNLTTHAQTANGVKGAANLTLDVVDLQPTNPLDAKPAGWKGGRPLEVVVENSDPARPQSGLQQADIVFEYESEYSITRFTAIYFYQPPGLVGPVRSCRMINPYLDFSYSGDHMCSGVSPGTARYLFGEVAGWSKSIGVINDLQPQYFLRSDAKVAPYNLYTNTKLALAARARFGTLPLPDYALEGSHKDSMAGTAAPDPAVPSQSVSYKYDTELAAYRRFDEGSPFMMADTGKQLAVKNVVLLHVPSHLTSWVEDTSSGASGAHGMWYELAGSGPADIYSDGRVIHATWHLGQKGQIPPKLNESVYFTDADGHFIVLNSGLTWIHLIS